MSTTARTSPPVAAERTRPGLALLLALLGIPGCTIAWELPLGGFWIGLPLSVAAIVLGLRARGGHGHRLAVAAIVLAVVEILFQASWTVAG